MTDKATDGPVLMLRGFGAGDYLGENANAELEYADTVLRDFNRKHAYRDLSCVRICPTRGTFNVRVVAATEALQKAPNQRFTSIWAKGLEVAKAYDLLVHTVLASPDLADWRYLLTFEEDNLPKPMTFLNLLEAADDGDWDVLGAHYSVKGPHGHPQIWGEYGAEDGQNYRPVKPRMPKPGEDVDPIVRCLGVGMGFTLFKLEVFRDRVPGRSWSEEQLVAWEKEHEKLVPRPASWFVHDPERDGNWTQDLWFAHRAHLLGIDLKIGVHCGERVAHLGDGGLLW